MQLVLLAYNIVVIKECSEGKDDVYRVEIDIVIIYTIVDTGMKSMSL